MPFMLLPFRPASDPSAARNFVRNFFRSTYEGNGQFAGDGLLQELRLAEPLVGSNYPVRIGQRRHTDPHRFYVA